MYVIFEEFTC